MAALRALRPLVSPRRRPHGDGRAADARRARAREDCWRSGRSRSSSSIARWARLSDEDWHEMSGRLRARAARLMRQLDAGAGYREQIEKDLAKRIGEQARPHGRRAASRPTPRGRAGVGRACLRRLRDGQRRRREVLQGLRAAAVPRADSTRWTRRTQRKSLACVLVKPILCVLGVLCVGRAQLVAQQGGFAMPDPKQMSGIPRPVDDLPNGAVSVRLIRGALSNNIAGQPVELHVGGKVDHGEDRRRAAARSSTALAPGATVQGERRRRRRAPRVAGVSGAARRAASG